MRAAPAAAPPLLGQLAIGLLFAAVLGVNQAAGGFAHASLYWLVLVPLVAGYLLSGRSLAAWTALVAATAAGLWLLAPDPTGSERLVGGLLERLALFAAAGGLAGALRAVIRRGEDELRQLALRDPLTGLRSRRAFTGLLAEAVAAAERDGGRLALLSIDLDRFKEYNDTLGHTAGDGILLWVAEVLEREVDRSGAPQRQVASICRLGGDEFTVVLPGVESRQEAAEVAKRVLDALCAPVTIGGVELFVGASIGVAIYPEDGLDVDALLRRADAGMQSAKERGGASFEFFAPWMNEASLRRIFVENRLRRAAVRDEISMVYQPLFDARSGRVVAAEVLARWHSPSLGEVSPSEFIPIAEDTAHLIVDIGDWVLTRAVEQLRRWDDAGLPRIRLSVNYSATQLRQLESVETIGGLLERTGLDPDRLELEVTERIVLAEDEPALEDLRRLRRRGIGIALDDFGTGNASISYLRRLPLTRVKIDRSFVSAVTANPEEANLTSSIVAMAKSLGLGVIAEGIETAEQKRLLEAIGCDELQGFLLSRPLPGDELAELLRRDAGRAPAPRRAAAPGG